MLDAITIAGAWRDDGQVAELSASKYYGQPRTVITIEALPTPPSAPDTNRTCPVCASHTVAREAPPAHMRESSENARTDCRGYPSLTA